MASILKSTPTKPAKFPPPTASRQHKLVTGDNWWNLATKYGRSDPWDIIEFNFGTRNPYEVNWYMEFYLGCSVPSPDGENFRFDGSDHPGILYIPAASWTRSLDLQLRRMVTTALSSAVVARMNVHHAGLNITGTKLAAVANRVIDGDIGVVDDGSVAQGEAEYDSGTNTIHLGFQTASSTTRQGLIVHEAVHAALDMKAVAGMTIAESEALAYVVQCYFVREQTPDPDTERLSSENPLKDRVYELAWDMAATLSKRTQPSSLEWLALDHAVRRHPKYRRTAGNIAGYNGI